MSTSGLTYLITGPSTGLGNALAKILLAQDGNTVIAVGRDSSSKGVQELQQTAHKGKSSKLIAVKLVDGSDKTQTQSAIDSLKQHNISHIDVVIANAGMHNSPPTVFDNDLKAFQDAIAVNTVAPLNLFNATRPLLLASTAKPKFVIISTLAGSVSFVGQSPMSSVTYSASKAAVNIVGIRLAIEEKNIITLMFHPGLVDTPGLTQLFERLGMSTEALESAGHVKLQSDFSMTRTLAEIAKATEKDSGRFIDSITGKDVPW